jgi:uncharacterized repeat protein (TIGR01451 family)
VVYVYRAGDPVQLSASAKVEPQWVQAGGVLSYTFTVSNETAFVPANGVVLSDALPLSTTFAWASGDYVSTGERVTWDLGSINPLQQKHVSLAVTVGITVPGGTPIVNLDYSVRNSQGGTLRFGAPATALVPWQFFLQLIVKN